MIVLGLGSSIVIARIYGVDVIGEYALTLAPVGLMRYSRRLPTLEGK